MNPGGIVFQSYAHLVLLSCFATFLAVAFAVAAAGGREQSRRNRAGTPLRVESHRAAYYEWMACHDGRRRTYEN